VRELILKKDGGVVLEGVGRALHLIGCIFASAEAISARIGVLAIVWW